MKKVSISNLIIILIMAVMLFGCAGKEEAAADNDTVNDTVETEAATETGSETEKETEAADGDGSDQNEDKVVSSGKKGSGSEEESTEGSPFGSKASLGGSKDDITEDWKKDYKEFLEKNPVEGEEVSFALIYVDEDDIPELVIDTGIEASGCQILTWHDGVMDELQTARLYFTYVEKGNLLDNCEGHMGYYYDYVYSIKNGKWKQIFNGEYSGFADNGEPDYDDERMRYKCTDYEVNGKRTDEDGYYKALYEVYDDGKNVTDPKSYLIYDDLMSFLETGKLLYETHRYELCVEDCTWEEAEKKCEKKGGYLASLTSDEEFKYVEDMIRSEDLTNICFYVGAKYGDDYRWHWTEPGLKQDNCVKTGYYQHWLDGGPTYTDTLADGTVIDENYVELMYRKSEDAFYLNDITNDVPGVYPSFKGRMGYICEYSK